MLRKIQRRQRRQTKLRSERLEPRRVLDSTVVFNEVMYNPAGSDESFEWIELHNQMSVDMDIAGWQLQNAVDYTFPPGTRLRGGDYLIVASDPQAMQSQLGIDDAMGPFAGRLANSGETIELRNHAGRLMNVLEYDDAGDWPSAADGSGASLMKRRAQDASEPAVSWTFSSVVGGTPGAENEVGVPASVVLNEVSAADTQPFWLELHNRSEDPVSTAGYVLALNEGVQHVLPAQSISAGGFVVVDSSQLGFKPESGDNLFLFSSDRRAVLDAVRVSDQLQGRAASMAGRWQTPVSPTPGQDNQFLFEDRVVINEIMYHDRPQLEVPAVLNSTPVLELEATWRFDQSGTDRGTAWRAVDFDDSSWQTGQGLFFDETSDLPGEKNTPLSIGHPTYYFRTTFDWDGDAQNAELGLSHVVDDGAVFYINGMEFLRYRMPEGEITFDTQAGSSIRTAELIGPVTIPPELLTEGTNTLAVELHQRPISSSDIAFGARIDRFVVAEPAIPYVASPQEWIELYNRGDQPVDLSQWRLTDAIDYAFPANTVIAPDEYLVVARDVPALRALHPQATIMGPFDGRLNDKQERITLLDQAGNTADQVHYFDDGRWPQFADGGGSSLELRNPGVDNRRGEAWKASDESSRSVWNRYTYTKSVTQISFDPPINFHEFVMGMLRAGEILLDNISVIENPGPDGVELIQNGTFENDVVGGPADKWRIQGTHEQSQVIEDPDRPGNQVLRLVAESRMNYLSNHAETTLANEARVKNGETYQISFDAKWISGSPQFHTELYYKDAAKTTILPQPAKSGTPGERNTAWQDNVGPTYDQLRHTPLIPTDADSVTVSVSAADADGIASMNLMYAVDGADTFTAVPMTETESGVYHAQIPPQSNRDVVQFYVRGEDTQGGLTMFPAEGPDSRALYRVDNSFTLDELRHDFRIIMTPADQRTLHDRVNMVNNNRLGSTVIYDADEVFYDVGTRLKGSMFSRQNRSSTGYNVRFSSDQLFRGVHDTVRFDQNGEAELLVKYLTAAAGNLGGSYDDVLQLTTPTGSGGGPTLTFLAAHDDLFLSEQFENGDDGTLFKMEGIRVMTSTVDRNDPESLKLFQPIGWVSQFDIADLGDDKELYRWPYLIHNNRDRDDYSRLIELAKAFSLTEEALDKALLELIDVDQWMSTFAIMSLFGIGDAYSQGNPHNLNIYVRPSDNKLLAFPWDWDFVFNQSPTAPLHGNKNMGRIINRPIFERIFLGHMQHLITTVFNRDHMEYWNEHFGDMLRQSFRGNLSRYDQRGDFVLNRLPEEIPFGIGVDGNNLVKTELIHLASPVSVLVPSPENGGDQLGVAWTTVDFAPSPDWIDGINGVGFEASPDDYADLIQTDVGQMQDVNPTVYIRMPFQADVDPGTIDRLKLRMKYDDGFVAYLNGVKVAAANAPSSLDWDSSATASHRDSDALIFATFDLTDHLGTLRRGENVLAIHGMNRSVTGNDLLFLAEMVAEDVIEKPPEEITVDDATVPLTGRGWVDVRHIRLAGESDPLDVHWSDTTTWQVEIPLQPGRNELTLEAVGLSGQLVGTARVNVTSQAVRPQLEQLRISEVMYHPVDASTREIAAGFTDEDDFEFVELLNTSPTTAVPLDGVQLREGIRFDFPAATLQPGERAVVVRNTEAFRLRYGDGPRVVGQYEGRLSNAGEEIHLLDAAGATIVQLRYRDDDPWPLRADGAGASLVLTDPLLTPTQQMNLSGRWHGSATYGGSPGTPDVQAPSVSINEFLASSDPPSLDTIELWNSSDQAVDIGGWYLSDSAQDLLKFQIPSGTSIAAGEYLVLDERHFNPTPANPSPSHFALNGTRGDDLWLVIPTPQGEVAQFVDDVHFGPSQSGESLGRVSLASPRHAPLSEPTFGGPNSPPRVGPIILSELHLHPATPSEQALAIDPSITTDDLEYIELFNSSTTAVDLSDWQLAGGVELEFAEGTTLAPGASLLVLSFNPHAPANRDRLAALREQYDLNIDASQFVGGYDGQLNDQGELVQLLRADSALDADSSSAVLLLEDEVVYEVNSPWPTDVRGSGKSLHRLSASVWGNAPTSWRAADATPASGALGNSDLNRDGMTDARDVDTLCVGVRAGDGRFDLDGNERVDSHDLTFLIETLIGTTIGDANLDGSFNSADLVSIFRAGQYEDGVDDNSTWDRGDWNCDGDFDSSDLVAAFRAGGFSATAHHQRMSPTRIAAAFERLTTSPGTKSLLDLDDIIPQPTVAIAQPTVARPEPSYPATHDLLFDQFPEQPSGEKFKESVFADLDQVDEVLQWL